MTFYTNSTNTVNPMFVPPATTKTQTDFENELRECVKVIENCTPAWMLHIPSDGRPELSAVKTIPVPVRAVYTPTEILKSGDATIVFWDDGTKTVVKRAPDEPDNAYAAFTAALAIKTYGSNSAVRRLIKRKFKLQKTKKGKSRNDISVKREAD